MFSPMKNKVLNINNVINKFSTYRKFSDINRKSQVADYYAGKSVFITGGTGFLGKVLIEKLLYSCKNINKVYVLVRDKKGVNAGERISSMLKAPVFDRLRNEAPENLKKIVPVSGDIFKKNLGISEADQKTVVENVSVVFHSAATISFNEPLNVAMATNVVATEEVVKLVLRLKNIKSFVHISTTYSNVDREKIEEKVYPPPASVEHALDIAERYSKNEDLIKKILDKRPNTYTYSKAIAEHVVASKCADIPTAIVRPSIVTSAAKEPVPGWIDSWSGATRIVYASANGLMRTMNGSASIRLDLIPVDMVVSCTIVAAAQCERSKQLKVYNCSSGASNPITLGEFLGTCRDAAVKNQLNLLPYPFLVYNKNPYLFKALSFVLQTVPYATMDLALIAKGEKPRYRKYEKVIDDSTETVIHFVNNQWRFVDYNVRELQKNMSDNDKEIFDFDIKSLNWKKCLEDYVYGINDFLIKKN